MSQVRNLRAMFEQGNKDTSPPDDRGRSSGASTPVPGGTESPRPLSKVRTSFVAIEKDGRIGLRRDPSHESSVSRRRLSMDTDAESVSTVPDKPTAALEDLAKPQRTFLTEPIPESPRQPPELEKQPSDIGAVSDKPSTNPDKHIDEESSPALLAPADPTEKSPIQEIKEPKATPTPVAVNGKHKVEKPKEAASPAPAKTAAVKKTTTRPSTISTKPATTKPPAKSPSAAKTPTTATHKPATKPAAKVHEKPVAKTAEKTAAKKEPATTARSGASAARPTASNANKKPQPLKPSASDTGFVKPKPKSPTKPVHLPASLMAPTASSVSKGSVPRQSLSRQSNSIQSLNASGRPASRASVSTTHTNTTAGKTVKRQSSTINRPRPSLGPPPKKTAHDHPVAKKDAHVDEGFLARMMRPTQASSQKTTEKAPVTPPRKTTKRPSTGADHKLRRETSVKNLGSAKKSVRKHAESTTSSEATAPATEGPPKPAQKEEVAIKEPAKETVRPQTPVQEPKETETVPEPSLEEVAVESANVETAEEAIELAKEADLVDEPVAPEEPMSDAKVEEPASLEQLKVEVANAKPEEPAFGEPKTPEEKPIEHEVEETITAPEPESTKEEPEKPEEVAEPKDEPVVTPIEPTLEPARQEEPAEDEKSEVVDIEDVTTSNLEKEMEKLQLADEKPVEVVKEDSEGVSKEDTATN
ncbi:Fc.00g004470.m01.CDS01 [Cosmosporella sp. VM-42]